jgi:hypothetical protein
MEMLIVMQGNLATGVVARRRMTSVEVAIWRSLLDTTAELRTLLGAKLLQESSLSPADFQVLLALREADGRRMRSSELAATIDWERSRLSHHLRRMERRGLIRRHECASDNRDTMNYWPPLDGVRKMFEDRRYGSSEIVQHRLARSTVVKTLNHIGYHELDDERRPVGSPERRTLGVAGDDPVEVGTVADVIERIGCDTVRLKSLRAGRLLEPGGPVFGISLPRTEFELTVHAQAA